MAEVKHVTISTPIEEILNIIDEDAGVIIDGFLNTKQIDQIKNDLDPFLKILERVKTNSLALKPKELVP